MKTPIFPMTPDYTPMMKVMEMQTKFAIEASQNMMKLAMMPWTGLRSTGFAADVETPSAPATAPAAETVAEPVAKTAKTTPAPTEETAVAAEVAEVVDTPVVQTAIVEAPVVETPVETSVEAAPIVEDASAGIVEDMAVEDTAAEDTVVEAVVEVAAAPVVEETVAETPVVEDEPAIEAPAALDAPIGDADDLTALKGVGPKLAVSLNEAGIYHFTQVADWSEANVAWVDANVPGVRGRCSKNGWVAQAAELTS